mgnify:CR=1 FL=1
MRTDIAISTRQNWTNAQTILDSKENPGRVLLVETGEARQKNWSQGLTQLLGMNGFEVDQIVLDRAADQDPALFQEQILQVVQEAADSTNLHLHLNGGTKWMQVMLSQAFPSAHSHYVDGRHHLQGGAEGWTVQPLGLRPDLNAILLCYGFQRVERTCSRSIDEALEDTAWEGAFSAWQQKAFRPNPGQIGQRIQQFRRNLGWLITRANLVGSQDGDLLLACGMEEETLHAYEQHCQWAKLGQARDWWFHSLVQTEWFIGHLLGEHRRPDDGPGWGHHFEHDAAHALAPFQKDWGVHQALRNLRVTSPVLHGGLHTELDILWLLESGRCLVFECKAWGGDQSGALSTRKDLAGRIQNYRACLGSMAQMVLVVKCSQVMSRERLEQTEDLAESLGLPCPIWITATPDQEVDIPGLDEGVPPLADQMERLGRGLRLRS